MTEVKVLVKKWLWLFGVIGMIFGYIILSSEIHEAHQGEIETITKIDNLIHQGLFDRRVVTADSIAVDITALGSVTVLSFLVVMLALLFFCIGRAAYAMHLSTAALSAAVLSKGLKAILQIPRPDELTRLVYASGYSFPSGHTLSAACIYLTIAFLLNRDLRRSNLRTLMNVAFGFLILSVGFSRLYLGVHYFSDVIGGLLIGVSLAVVLSRFPQFFDKIANMFSVKE